MEPAIDMRDPTLQVFLNQISWLCDYAPGGDTANSVAIVVAASGWNYWIAANFDPRLRMREHLGMVLNILARLKTLPLEMNATVGSQILEATLKFSTEKYQFYKKRLEKAVSLIKGIKTRRRSSIETQFLEKTEMLLYLDKPLDLSVGAYRFAMTTILRKVHRKHRKKMSENAGSVWYDVCHYVGRLGSWVRSVLILIRYVRSHQEVVENYVVDQVPSPKVAKPLHSRRRPTLYDILREIFPKDNARAERLYKRLKAYRKFDFDAAFTKKCRGKNSRYASRSHSEMILLEHLRRLNTSFFQDIKYIASSKRSCFCCDLFFDLQGGDVATRSTHGNVWERWCIPPGLEREDRQLMEQGKETVLGRMNARLSLEIVQLIEDGAPRHVRFKDSTTGMWTAPTWGLSKT